MRIFLVFLAFLFSSFLCMSLVANYLGSIEDAKKIEIIGNSLYSNKTLYAQFLKNPEKQTEILENLDLEGDFQKYKNRIGLFKNEYMYLSYYSGYETSVYYFPEKKCWDNLNGMYKWINLTRCKDD